MLSAVKIFGDFPDAVHIICGNERKTHYVNLCLHFQGWAAFLCVDGQGSESPQARSATVLGKNCRSHWRSVELHAWSK